MKVFKITLFFVASILFFSCSDNNKNEGNLATLTGVYIYDENFSLLTECTTKKEYWINDNDGKLLEACKKIQNGDEPKPLYVELKGTLAMPATSGEAATYENVFDLVEIDLITLKINEKCQNISETGFELFGNTPRKWSLKYEKEYMRFQAFSPDTTIIFPYQDPISVKGGEKIYDIENEGYMHIRFSIAENPCKTNLLMPSKYSSWAKVDGLDSFSGCGKMILIEDKN